jgi:3-hydroxyisobutyrate dehydrogenase
MASKVGPGAVRRPSLGLRYFGLSAPPLDNTGNQIMPLQISPDKTRIGWIGTGVMGRSMCGHLIAAGYKVTLFTRTKEKAKELIEKGATWASSPREVAAGSDVVISIVGFPSDVRQVLLGDDGALAEV